MCLLSESVWIPIVLRYVEILNLNMSEPAKTKISEKIQSFFQFSLSNKASWPFKKLDFISNGSLPGFECSFKTQTGSFYSPAKLISHNKARKSLSLAILFSRNIGNSVEHGV